MDKHAVTVDTREEALAKALDETKRVCNENSTADIHQMNILHTKEPPRYAANSKVFSYAPEKPVPDKGVIVHVWGGGVREPDRVFDISIGRMAHSPHGMLLACEWSHWSNWRVVGQEEERQPMHGATMYRPWCRDCANKKYAIDVESCKSCTITRPSNFQEESNDS